MSFSVGTGSTLLYVLSHDGPLVVHRLPIGREDLEQRTALFVGLLAYQPTGADSERAAAAALATLLLGPAEQAISSARRLVVVPDGPLHTLPFAALLRPDGRRLVQALPVSTVASLTVLSQVRHNQANQHPRPLLAAGDPEPLPLLASGEPLTSLPGARREVQAIAARWGPGASVLVGPQASEGAITRLAPDAGVLHLATHALIDARSPDRGLALSAPPSP